MNHHCWILLPHHLPAWCWPSWSEALKGFPSYAGRSSPPLGWANHSVHGICGIWFQRKPTGCFSGYSASALEVSNMREAPLGLGGKCTAGSQDGEKLLKEDRQSPPGLLEAHVSWKFTSQSLFSSLIINSTERKRLIICISKFFSLSDQPINSKPSICLSIILYKALHCL